MKTLIISNYGVKVKVEKGLLLVKSENSKTHVSMTDVEQIIVVTGGVSLTSKAVRSMIEHGIDLVFLDSRGKPIGRVYPPYINRTVNTRRCQYLAYTDSKGLKVAKAIVEAKIRNQAGLLRRYSRGCGDQLLRELSRDILKYTLEIPRITGGLEECKSKLLNLEAKAARLYWAGVSRLVPGDLKFEYRDQDGLDYFNIMLNYGYGILYSEAWKALVLAGLDPYAGYLHSDKSGKPTLAFDYVEMFRCSLVDHTLLQMVRRGWRPQVENGFLIAKSRSEIVKRIVEAMDRRVYVSDKPLKLSQAIKRWAFNLASYVRGETRRYMGFVERW